MSLNHRALQIACLAGAVMAAAPLSAPARDRELVGISNAGGAPPPPARAAALEDSLSSRVPRALPVVAEHKYRMLAKVRPLLFWISKDDVGGARILSLIHI